MYGQMLEWNEPKKNCIHKSYLQENTGDGVVISAVAGLLFFQNGLYHRWFSMKIVKFYRTSFLQNNAARLLLIFCKIVNVSLALPLINQFSHT